MREKQNVNGGTKSERGGINMNPTSSKRKVTFCDVVKRNIASNAGNKVGSAGDKLLVTKIGKSAKG